MTKKDLISLQDLENKDIEEIFAVTRELKQKLVKREEYYPLKGKVFGLIFQKPSTRTRVSFKVGILQLGGHAIFLSGRDIQLNRGETVSDTAKVLSRYLDGIVIRTFNHEDVVELAGNSTIPVINGLTDLMHPCQVLSDLFTIKEKMNILKGLKLAYVGDGNNVANSLLHGCSKAGMDIWVATPKGYEPDGSIVGESMLEAKKTNSEIHIINDPREAVVGADVVYTDTWISMGQEDLRERKLRDFEGFQVNMDLIELAKPGAFVMHCLPAHRGEEITSEVLDGKHSIVFDQAENRLHVQKAIICLLSAKN